MRNIPEKYIFFYIQKNNLILIKNNQLMKKKIQKINKNPNDLKNFWKKMKNCFIFIDLKKKESIRK